MGLQGPGIDGFLQRDLPWLLSRGARAVVSVAGHTVREYGELAARLSDAAGVSAIEVNLGCPDASAAGRPFALDPRPPGRWWRRCGAAPGTTSRSSRSCRRRLPTSCRSREACVSSGADGLSLVNTVPGMAIDPATMRPALAGLFGGLSGPAIRPLAVRCVWQVREALPDVPLIGTGGVRTGPGRAGVPARRSGDGRRRDRAVPRSLGLLADPA